MLRNARIFPCAALLVVLLAPLGEANARILRVFASYDAATSTCQGNMLGEVASIEDAIALGGGGYMVEGSEDCQTLEGMEVVVALGRRPSTSVDPSSLSRLLSTLSGWIREYVNNLNNLRNAAFPPQLPASDSALVADISSAIRSCTTSSVVSEVEAMAAKQERPIILQYGELNNAWGTARCDKNPWNWNGHNRHVTITMNSALRDSTGSDRMHQLAIRALHEYHHAKDMLTLGCSEAHEVGESDVRKRAHGSYMRIYDKLGPGMKGYNKATHGTAPPPCQ